MQCKMLQFVFIFMRFHVQWLFIGALQRMRVGLINSRFWLHVALYVGKYLPYRYYRIWILFKVTFLRVLFYVQMIEVVPCNCFLLRVLCTGWPGTCAMTELQYLNVFGLPVWTGFIELHTVWSLIGWTQVSDVLWGDKCLIPLQG